MIGDDDVFCVNCGCNLHDYPEIVYGRLLTKINYFKNLFDSIDFSKENYDKEKMSLFFAKKFNIDYPMSNVLIADLLDWLSYLSQNDGIISDEEVNFINYILNLDLTREDIFNVYFNTDIEFTTILPESFIYLYEYDLTNNIEDLDKKTVETLKHLYMRIGEAFINCENRFKSTDELIIDLKRFDEYLDNLNDNISNFENVNYNNLVKEISQNTPNTNVVLNNNFEDNVDDNDKTLEDYIDELNKLIGLETVKSDVKSLINLIQVRQVREQRGMKQSPMSLHLVFSGNPGTGKTTVARLLAKIYHKMGLLSKGHLIETDRSGLVGGYVGQTAIKTQEVIQNTRVGFYL